MRVCDVCKGEVPRGKLYQLQLAAFFGPKLLDWSELCEGCAEMLHNMLVAVIDGRR